MFDGGGDGDEKRRESEMVSDGLRLRDGESRRDCVNARFGRDGENERKMRMEAKAEAEAQRRKERGIHPGRSV